MRLRQVLWFMVVGFSVNWKTQLSGAQETDANRSRRQDIVCYEKAKVETHHSPLLMYLHDRQRRTAVSSTGEYDNWICVPENEITGAGAAVVNGAANIVQGDTGRQNKSLITLELQKSREVSILPTDEASSLGQMLVAMVKAELKDCALVVAYDTGYSGHAVLQHLLLLHNPRQVVHVNTAEDLTRIIWTSSKCRGYFFLLDDPEPLLTLATTYKHSWDYGGRYILVLPSKQNLETFVDSDVGKMTENIVGVVKSGTEGEWVLYMNQLYWGPGVRRINTWYRHRFTRQLDLFPDKMADFQGAVLKVSTFTFEPCNFLHRAENGTVVLFYGTDVETVKAVAGVLNITLKFKETPNGETWGEQYENGSWYGLMGELQRQDADIGLANLFNTRHWTQVIDLTAPYRTEMMIFLIRVEPPLPHWQALSFPFNQWTWLGILVGLIISGPILYLFARGSAECGGEIKILQDLSYSWYYAFGMHFCEAHASLPYNPCTQVFVQFLWLYTLIMTISYSASLKSFLIMKKKPYMIQTIKELYESGLELAGTTDLFKYELAVSTNPYLKGMVNVFKYYDVLENIYPPVLAGKTVYLGNELSMDYLIKNRFSWRGVSSVRIMKEFYGSYGVSLGLPHHSPLKRKFDQVIGWVQQAGLYHKFTLDTLRLDASLQKGARGGIDSTIVQEEPREDGVVALNLDNMQGLFIITVFGWIFGALAFMLEKTV